MNLLVSLSCFLIIPRKTSVHFQETCRSAFTGGIGGGLHVRLSVRTLTEGRITASSWGRCGSAQTSYLLQSLCAGLSLQRPETS